VPAIVAVEAMVRAPIGRLVGTAVIQRWARHVDRTLRLAGGRVGVIAGTLGCVVPDTALRLLWCALAGVLVGKVHERLLP
jgi:hypothetical protein